jgi:carotenoid 1,2-hydratase
VSDDGKTAVVVIAMVGAPFSPGYARARAKGGPVDPLDFSAFNVSVTGPGASRWALTERPRSAVSRDAKTLAIGRSSMRWLENGSLVIDVDERSAPWGRPLRGCIVFHPDARTDAAVAIDGSGDHLWWPMAPLGRVEVGLVDPCVRFTGSGYLDANAGRVPLEESFSRWSWARLSRRGEVAITYDVVTRSLGERRHGFVVDSSGVRELDGGESTLLGTTRFGLPISVRCPGKGWPRLARTVEDGPFYARSIVSHRDGELASTGIHEVVSLDRFASSWVQFLIPFRMRREAA